LQSIFIGSNGKPVTQYQTKDGVKSKVIKVGKKGALKLAMHPKSDILAVGHSSIRLVDLESGEKKKLEAPFTGGVNSLNFSQCGKYLGATGHGLREVVIFDLDLATEPLCIIPVDGYPQSITLRSQQNGIIEILCLYEEKNGCIIIKNGDNINKIKIKTEGVILTGAFGTPFSFTEKGITLAMGKISKPDISTFDYDINSNTINLTKNDDKSKSESNSAIDNNSKSNDANTYSNPMLGPEKVAGIKRISTEEVAAEEDNNSNKKKKNENMKADDEDDEGNNELTLEERLEQLSASMNELENTTETNLFDETPTSDSLVTLIEQALQSGDDSLLEQCLSVDDIRIVEATVRGLSTSKVIAFMKKLMAKFEKRPSRGALLTHWLAATLTFHISYLMSVPNLSGELSGLSQMLEARLTTYQRLASLSGRLELLLGQSGSTNQYDENQVQVYRE
jgi:hypothetical protein